MTRPSIAASLLVLAWACAPAKPPPEAPTKPRLELSLPAGVEVTVDGEAHGTTPLGLDLEPGAHAVSLATSCATAELQTTLAAGETTTIGREEAQALGFATLQVTTGDIEGKALVHTLSVDEQVVATGGRSEVTVSACPHRLDVASEGLGSWTEHVTFERDQPVTREVTLSLGPDMVRVPGGHFRMGPPGPSRYIPGKTESEIYELDGWPWIHTLEVDLPPFDIDLTKVTAAQFHACRQSGKCPWEAMRLSYTEPVPRQVRHLCVTDGRQQRKPLPGKENHPINCIPRWEAEIYCASVGKRLPTDAEWEYAARGGREDYYCPWGPLAQQSKLGRGLCFKRGPEVFPEVEPECSHPDENSPFGLCDMVLNGKEFVTWTEGRSTGDVRVESPHDDPTQVLVRGGGQPVFVDAFVDDRAEYYYIGFRCVRDMRAGAANDGH